jgi:hypothetical protein
MQMIERTTKKRFFAIVAIFRGYFAVLSSLAGPRIMASKIQNAQYCTSLNLCVRFSALGWRLLDLLAALGQNVKAIHERADIIIL